VKRKDRFDPAAEPYENDRLAYQGLVWQCRYSGVEVPDSLWRHVEVGRDRFYADDRSEDMMADAGARAAFDAWTDAFVAHVSGKGPVPGTKEAANAAAPTA
jgi:hypothetical protein